MKRLFLLLLPVLISACGVNTSSAQEHGIERATNDITKINFKFHPNTGYQPADRLSGNIIYLYHGYPADDSPKWVDMPINYINEWRAAYIATAERNGFKVILSDEKAPSYGN